MKLTKNYIKSIIKEELENLMSEAVVDPKLNQFNKTENMTRFNVSNPELANTAAEKASYIARALNSGANPTAIADELSRKMNAQLLSIIKNDTTSDEAKKISSVLSQIKPKG